MSDIELRELNVSYLPVYAVNVCDTAEN